MVAYDNFSLKQMMMMSISAVVGQLVYGHSLCNGTVRIVAGEGCDWLGN